jgi:hypothetical protein
LPTRRWHAACRSLQALLSDVVKPGIEELCRLLLVVADEAADKHGKAAAIAAQAAAGGDVVMAEQQQTAAAAAAAAPEAANGQVPVKLEEPAAEGAAGAGAAPEAGAEPMDVTPAAPAAEASNGPEVSRLEEAQEQAVLDEFCNILQKVVDSVAQKQQRPLVPTMTQQQMQVVQQQQRGQVTHSMLQQQQQQAVATSAAMRSQAGRQVPTVAFPMTSQGLAQIPFPFPQFSGAYVTGPNGKLTQQQVQFTLQAAPTMQGQATYSTVNAVLPQVSLVP